MIDTSQMGKTARAFNIMAKPIGPICNLDCKYCYYLEKEALYKNEGKWKMSSDLLERYIAEYIEAQPGDKVTFAWQGGEPTLLGVDYFREIVRLQEKYRGGKTIENALQTNGTLLNDGWATFFKEHDFLLGVSIDGPEALHNHYRVDKNQGSTFKQVMKGIECLQRNEVRFNTLTCLNRVTAKKPVEIYRFLKGIGSDFMQFIPIVERLPGSESKKWGLDYAAPDEGVGDSEQLPVTAWSVLPKDFGDFYVQVFDRWVKRDVGRIFVQLIEVVAAKWLGAPGGLCVHEAECGSALAMEHNGDVYSCDHFVYPQYRLGNLKEKTLVQMVESDEQIAFGRAKKSALPQYCLECEVRSICNGGCPKERFIHTPDGDPGLNYLCAGYRDFFNHTIPVMQELRSIYQQQLPINELMKRVKAKAIPNYKPRS